MAEQVGVYNIDTMGLTTTDLEDIKTIVNDGNQALENDVREIYRMLSKLQRGMITDSGFRKLSLNDKLLTLNTELLAVARRAGIKLPR